MENAKGGSGNLSLDSQNLQTSAFNTRNALSTLKRLKPASLSRSSKYKPVRLCALEKEVLEAENEPLEEIGVDKQSENSINSIQTEFLRVLTNGVETKKELPCILKTTNRNYPIDKETNGTNKTLDNSDIGVAWLNTPMKTMQVTENSVNSYFNQCAVLQSTPFSNSTIPVEENISSVTNSKSHENVNVKLQKDIPNEHILKSKETKSIDCLQRDGNSFIATNTQDIFSIPEVVHKQKVKTEHVDHMERDIKINIAEKNKERSVVLAKAESSVLNISSATTKVCSLIENNDIATPNFASYKFFQTPLAPENRKIKSNLVHQFVTPKTKPTKEQKQLKIQCPIDVAPLLKTPINNGRCFGTNLTPAFSKLAIQDKYANRKNVSFAQNIQFNPTPKYKINANVGLQNQILNNKENESEDDKLKSQLTASLQNILSNTLTVQNTEYIILNQLGKGGSCVVYHCYDPVTKAERAIKKVNLARDEVMVSGFINEVKMLEKLQKCDHIIKMYTYEIVESQRVLYVVLEKGGADLSKILKDLSSTDKHLPMYMLMYYWMQMLYAVKQIHENGIIHSDLKPANFLVAEDGLKLIDFGISSCMQADMTSVIKHVSMGSFNYISPEALNNDTSKNCNSPNYGKPKYKINYKSDVWSLGCILYQLVYRQTPFQQYEPMLAKVMAILDPVNKVKYPSTPWVPQKMVNTVKKCLQVDVKSRPSVDELIKEYENMYF